MLKREGDGAGGTHDNRGGRRDRLPYRCRRVGVTTS
jgi:hypothetical protein